MPRSQRRLAAALAIGSMAVALLLSLAAFASTLGHEEVPRVTANFRWLDMGHNTLRLGWILDPITAAMLVMITFVGGLIFVYSVGYMAHDDNFTRFFCFLSLFAGAMLGVVVANSLLLLFISWELVGLASYLLIGFWYEKPSAAAAAKKAFIVTRIGDLGLFLGMLWLYGRTDTLLFYDAGRGCLEPRALANLAGQLTTGGLAVSTCIGLLIFCGAVGKSGQAPLHVWLPDAMEGPTPVSALIHAATMVAAGVFLVARVYPLMAADPTPVAGQSTALVTVAWVGAITAAFAALIAVAQNDIKRILAYSTVSQLGYMMLGLGTGGVAVGMFHLLTHAFFKALLFLGSGSVIHGCHEEQDIRLMGGLRRHMPVTFATYAVGMMALAGVPLFFSGFWSKDEILHGALYWPLSRGPFYLGVFGALLTAFYMTRQVAYVFFGSYRGEHGTPHESPRVMTAPLVILAVCTVLLSVIGTPLWPWAHHYLSSAGAARVAGGSVWLVMMISTAVVVAGVWMAGVLYKETPGPDQPDPLERLQPGLFAVLRGKFFVDELYAATVVKATSWCATAADWLDRHLWGGLVKLIALGVMGLSWLSRLFDEFVINLGFDGGCNWMRGVGSGLAFFQNGRVQRYLRVLGLGLAVLGLWLLWF